ncbi:MarR family winged helix-turn-helix transcriptional regulator [Polyangium mundeleinium]|uniref:MarR family transcriptional regulator n=1 Tax=Polyangium mundeleinium TaxID=2995306 RepID=A0ABT5EQD7_9BACT|nr:MarR family transcriptional regulator [Polyangium mundeleinium]MDC0742990.1 MarR family transcriptional regulator [Polyangium mundeleinium]
MSAYHLTFFFDLNRAHATVIRRFDGSLGGVHGIGLNDLHLLQVLDQAPERRLRRIDLAQQLGVTASGVTWMLRPLAQRGLVTSQPSEEDGRVTFAVLTPAGRQLLADAVPTARRIAADLLGPEVNKEELTRGAAVITRLG